MKYTVTLKLAFPDGHRCWACRMYPNADDEAEALREATELLRDSSQYKECMIIEHRIKPFEDRDTYTFTYDTNLWTLKEENENAPAEIARALNRIANNIGKVQMCLPPDRPQNSGTIFSIITTISSAVMLAILIVLLLSK